MYSLPIRLSLLHHRNNGISIFFWIYKSEPCNLLVKIIIIDSRIIDKYNEMKPSDYILSFVFTTSMSCNVGYMFGIYLFQN